MSQTVDQLREAIVAAYLAGEKIPDIEARFEVGSSTIYHFLRQSKVVPLRRDRRLGNDGTDVLIQGLRELIEVLDRQNDELRSEVAALKRAAKVRERGEHRARKTS